MTDRCARRDTNRTHRDLAAGVRHDVGTALDAGRRQSPDAATMTASHRLLIIGSSGHARVVIDVVEKMGDHLVVGLIDRFRMPGETTLGYPVLGGEADMPSISETLGATRCFVAIGDNYARREVALRVRELVPRLPFSALVHPSAVLARGTVIGTGSVVMAGAVLNTNARIGEFCIVNTQASIDHDSTLDDYASVAPGVTTGGGVRVGECSAVSIGATILHSRRIGEHTIVGAGAVVTKDVPAYSVAYGIPARVIRPRKAGEPYL